MKIYRALRSSFYWTKALDRAANNDCLAAMAYLEKYSKFSKFTYSALLLKGYIHYSLQEYESSKSSSIMAIEKINSSRDLNRDEKKYLTAYAHIIINKSQTEMEGLSSSVPIDMSFNLENVHESLRKNFRLSGLQSNE